MGQIPKGGVIVKVKWPDVAGLMKDKERASLLVGGVFLFVAGSWLAFFFVWAIHVWPHRSLSLNPQEAGLFGDTFGAINALFSGLALTGVAFAILLQHQELDATNEQLKIARNEAAESESARRQTSDLMLRQTELMLATARLNAAQAISNTLRGNEMMDIMYRGRLEPVSRVAVNRQYIRMVVNDMAGIVGQTVHSPPPGASMYRRYLLSALTGAYVKLTSNWEGAEGIPHLTLDDLRNELRCLIAQDSILGTQDETVLKAAIQTIENCADYLMDIKFKGEEVNRLAGAIFGAISMAQSWPV